MRFREAHQLAMDAAAEAHEVLGVDTFSRIDIFEIIVASGLKLFFRPIGEVAGAYLSPKEVGTPGVIVNSSHPLALQRYSAGHELGHHHFDHGGQIDYGVELAGQSDREILAPEEMLAEAFASWFLMPPELIELFLEQLEVDRPRTPRDAYQLALRLGTSYQATCYHLPSVGLLSSGQGHEWAQLTLRTIKEQLTAAPRPRGWRFDVWIIRESDRGQLRTVRAGDRLVIELADVEVATLPAGLELIEVAEPSLFSATPAIEIDIADDAPAGPMSVELTVADEPFELELEVEQPHVGVYLERNRSKVAGRE